MNIERIKEELARTYVKIEKLQKKARDLEEQKKQAELFFLLILTMQYRSGRTEETGRGYGVSENYPKQWSFRRGTSVND